MGLKPFIFISSTRYSIDGFKLYLFLILIRVIKFQHKYLCFALMTTHPAVFLWKAWKLVFFILLNTKYIRNQFANLHVETLHIAIEAELYRFTCCGECWNRLTFRTFMPTSSPFFIGYNWWWCHLLLFVWCWSWMSHCGKWLSSANGSLVLASGTECESPIGERR